MTSLQMGMNSRIAAGSYCCAHFPGMTGQNSEMSLKRVLRDESAGGQCDTACGCGSKDCLCLGLWCPIISTEPAVVFLLIAVVRTQQYHWQLHRISFFRSIDRSDGPDANRLYEERVASISQSIADVVSDARPQNFKTFFDVS